VPRHLGDGLHPLTVEAHGVGIFGDSRLIISDQILLDESWIGGRFTYLMLTSPTCMNSV
jgi:hypothetical protein